MNAHDISVFLSAATAVAASAVGLYFLRFWRQTRDRFFALFAFAFWGLTVNWIGVALTEPVYEAWTYFYVIRLVAFVLIIIAVVDKNRSASKD